MKEKPLNKDKKSRDRKKSCLILYNDEVNTFEHVIRSLVDVCGHDPVQAEQCAMLVHLKGSCEIKIGNGPELLQMSKSLGRLGLNSRVYSMA